MEGEHTTKINNLSWLSESIGKSKKVTITKPAGDKGTALVLSRLSAHDRLRRSYSTSTHPAGLVQISGGRFHCVLEGGWASFVNSDIVPDSKSFKRLNIGRSCPCSFDAFLCFELFLSSSLTSIFLGLNVLKVIFMI